MKYRFLALMSLTLCAVYSNAQTLEDFGEDKNIAGKMKIAEQLVNDAADFFKEVSLGRAMREFEKNPRWRHGEFEINVFDSQGNCYLFGTLLQDLWENFKNVQRSRKLRGMRHSGEGTNFIEDLIKKGDAGGGWVSFDWVYETFFAYARTVIRDGTKFIIFAGMYPESPRFQVRELVRAAAGYAREKGVRALFAQINNPAGEFVRGDVYLWAYDFEGNNYAHGRNLAWVGQNMLDYKDSAGNYRNRMVIDLVKKRGSGWLEYEEDGIKKIAYVEQITDSRTGKHYVIGAGYYPQITKDDAVAYVKRAVEYLKAQGATVALRDFTSYAGGFIKGPLRISVLSLEGEILADAYNPIFIGQNLINSRDAEGKYIVRGIIDVAKEQGRGWFTYLDSGAYKSIYLELVETPEGKFIVLSGFWPASKKNSAETLVEKAVAQLQRGDTVESLRMFTSMAPDFLRGDLFVEVYTDEGITLAYGLDRDRIWFDEKTVLDEKGVPYINRVIDVAKRGGGWTEYYENKAKRKIYAKQVVKEEFKDPDAELTDESMAEYTQKSARVVKREPKKKETSKHTYIVAVSYYE